MLIDDKTNSSDKPIRIAVRLSLEFDTKTWSTIRTAMAACLSGFCYVQIAVRVLIMS